MTGVQTCALPILLTAGLGMLAGRSPFFGVNVGQGALAGVQSYYNNIGKQIEAQKAARELGIRQYEAETQRGTLGIQQLELRQKLLPILQQIAIWSANPANKGQPLPEWMQSAVDMAKTAGLDVSSAVSAGADTSAPANTKFGPRATPAPDATFASGPTDITPKPVSGETAPKNESANLVTTLNEKLPTDNAPEIPANKIPPANFYDETMGKDSLNNPYYFYRYAASLNAQGLTTQAQIGRAHV